MMSSNKLYKVEFSGYVLVGANTPEEAIETYDYKGIRRTEKVTRTVEMAVNEEGVVYEVGDRSAAKKGKSKKTVSSNIATLRKEGA